LLLPKKKGKKRRLKKNMTTVNKELQGYKSVYGINDRSWDPAGKRVMARDNIAKSSRKHF